MAISLLHPLFLLPLSLILLPANAHNITAILATFPEYTQFNTYLTQTKLNDEINNRQPVTVLVVKNNALSSLVDKHPLSVIKNALSIHVLLDYFDAVKLHKIANGTLLSTTLYQTTGLAGEHLGFVNITDLRGGKVGFGSAVPGSALDSTYTKEAKKVPYSLSVVEISQPIIAPGIMTETSPSASDVNITALLVKAGCNTFVSFIVSTGVIKVYQETANKGLTLFAPTDEAFKAKGLQDLNKLTNAQLVSLLQYHALASYSPVGTLKSTKAPMSTLATGEDGKKYQLGVTTAGDEVTLHAGLDSSRVARTVIDTTPLCVFTIDSVLLPAELFGKGTTPATSPATPPVTSPATSPTTSPASAPKSVAPTPSPPASPMESPEYAPSVSPVGPRAGAHSRSGNAIDVKASKSLTVAVAVILVFFLG